MSHRIVALALPALLLLTACTNPDRSGSGPSPTVTSHTDGAVITGDREITLGGTLGGDAVITGVRIDVNGTTYTADADGNAFSAVITLEDNANDVEVTAADAAGRTGSTTLTLVYPFVELTTFQRASVIIGQPDGTTSDSTLDDSSVRIPYGNPIVHQGRLYLPDYGNDRILVYGTVPTVDGAAAGLVLGQTDFVSDRNGTSATTFDGPQTVTTDGDRILITDYHNSRILVWNAPPTTNGAPADQVVGQPDLDSGSQACSRDGLAYPESATVADGKLIVADTDNNRVLVWNTVPDTNGAPADLVLGQGAFDTCAENDDNQDGTPDAHPTGRTLFYPSDVWSDGERLIVADADNFRVLIWNTFPETDFQPADVVLGQDDFTTQATGARVDRFAYPYFLTSNGNQLVVADSDAHRVLVWDTVPTTNAAPADHVLGQADFTHDTPNDDDQDGSPDGAPSARTMDFPAGVHYFADKLIVADNDNDRYVIFE